MHARAPAGARLPAGSQSDTVCKLANSAKDPIGIGPVLILSALIIPLILNTKQADRVNI